MSNARTIADLAAVTATPDELNFTDGSVAGTVVNSKAVVYGPAGEIASNGLMLDSDATVSGTLKATAYEETFSSVTSSTGSSILDCTLGNVFEHVLTENTTFVFAIPSGDPTNSFGFNLGIRQDASASGYTVTWPASVVWPNATPPALSATADADDQFVFYTNDNGSSWYGFIGGYSFG